MSPSVSQSRLSLDLALSGSSTYSPVILLSALGPHVLPPPLVPKGPYPHPHHRWTEFSTGLTHRCTSSRRYGAQT